MMSTAHTSSHDSLDAGAIVALGLLGAGLAIGAGTLLRTPESRDACIRFLRELGLPQMGREVAAGILLKLGTSLSGHDAIDGARQGRR
jgi:hypothetical protein